MGSDYIIAYSRVTVNANNIYCGIALIKAKYPRTLVQPYKTRLCAEIILTYSRVYGIIYTGVERF